MRQFRIIEINPPARSLRISIAKDNTVKNSKYDDKPIYGTPVLCVPVRFGRNKNLVRYQPIPQPSRSLLRAFLGEIAKQFIRENKSDQRHDYRKEYGYRGKQVDFLT